MSNNEKIIWSYWHDPNNIPYIVTLAILTWKKHNPDYTIHFMNENNSSFFDFISTTILGIPYLWLFSIAIFLLDESISQIYD